MKDPEAYRKNLPTAAQEADLSTRTVEHIKAMHEQSLYARKLLSGFSEEKQRLIMSLLDAMFNGVNNVSVLDAEYSERLIGFLKKETK